MPLDSARPAEVSWATAWACVREQPAVVLIRTAREERLGCLDCQGPAPSVNQCRRHLSAALDGAGSPLRESLHCSDLHRALRVPREGGTDAHSCAPRPPDASPSWASLSSVPIRYGAPVWELHVNGHGCFLKAFLGGSGAHPEWVSPGVGCLNLSGTLLSGWKTFWGSNILPELEL